MLTLFRWLGRCEGCSFLLLLGFAMPLKYIWSQPQYVHVIGMAHGALFVAYVMAATYFAVELKWSIKVIGLCFMAAVVPFGTFLFEKRYLAAIMGNDRTSGS